MQNINKCKLWTAVVTPFNKNGDIDYKSFYDLILKQQAAGNGIIILGSTGEGLAINSSEKKLLTVFVSTLKLTIPVIVGIGGFQLSEQLELIDFYQSLKNICGFLLPTPLYAKPGIIGQTAWFKVLLDQSNLPCMLYNIPGRSAVKLHPEVLTNLQHHKNLWALKDSSGSVAEFQNFHLAAPKLKLFSGDDDMTPFYALLGAAGLVSVASNAWPKETKLFVEKSLSGKGAGLLVDVWQSAIDALFQSSNPVPIKMLLFKKGWIKTPTLRPPLSQNDLPDVAQLLKMDRLVQNWYKKQTKS